MKIYVCKSVIGPNTPPLFLEDLLVLSDGSINTTPGAAWADAQNNVAPFVTTWLTTNKASICCLDHEINLSSLAWDGTSVVPNAQQGSLIKWCLNAADAALKIKPRGFGFYGFGPGAGYNPFSPGVNPGQYQPLWAQDLGRVRPVYSHSAVTHVFPYLYCPYYPCTAAEWIASRQAEFTALQSFKKIAIPFISPFIVGQVPNRGQYIGDGMWRTVLDFARDTCNAACLWLDLVPFNSPQCLDILSEYITF